MSFLDPLRPYISLIKLLGFLACVVVAFSYGCSKGKASGSAEVARIRTERAQELAEIAQAAKDASEKARAAEIAVAQSFAKIHDQHAKDLLKADHDEKATVAALLADPDRLRPEWRCPATPAAPGVAHDPGQGDGGAQLRAEGAAALIADADRADADIREWQARWDAWKTEYEKYRKAVVQ